MRSVPPARMSASGRADRAPRASGNDVATWTAMERPVYKKSNIRNFPGSLVGVAVGPVISLDLPNGSAAFRERDNGVCDPRPPARIARPAGRRKRDPGGELGGPFG